MCDGRTPTPEELPSCYEGSDWSGCTLQQFMDCPYNLANNRQVQQRRKRSTRWPKATTWGSKTCVYCRKLSVAGSSHGYSAPSWRKCSQEGKAQINPQPITFLLGIYFTANTLKNCWFQPWYCYWSPQPGSPAPDRTFAVIKYRPTGKNKAGGIKRHLFSKWINAELGDTTEIQTHSNSHNNDVTYRNRSNSLFSI